MRIGVISDTHGNILSIHRAVEAVGPVDMWLHAGDHSWDATELSGCQEVPVTAVAGNCDGSNAASIDEFVDVGGKRIWLTHGHRYRAKERINELCWWARQYAVDVVVFGHSHIALIHRDDDLLVFNPGSSAYPRGGSGASAGLLVIENDRIEPSIVEL